MNLVNYWIGAFGRYEIPQAILWLADAANARLGLPPIGGPRAWIRLDERNASPGFKVIEEWGAWRDREEAKRWAQESPCPT